jgi:hypothetical protein
MHPTHGRNLFDLGLLIARVPSVTLKPVMRDLHTVVRDPVLAKMKRFTENDLFYEKGKLLTDPVDVVWRWGELLKNAIGTLTADPRFLGDKVPYPSGLAVFRPSGEGADGRLEEVARRLVALFDREESNPTLGFSSALPGQYSGGKILLGYSKRKLPEGQLGYSNTFADNVAFLRDDVLSGYLVGVAKGIADCLGIQYDRIPDWAVLIAGYNTRTHLVFSAKDNGFHIHTDGCRDFGNYPGVVANMTICPRRPDGKEAIKYFDLANILGKQEILRLALKSGDVTFLSGEPRFSWGHGVSNVETEQTHITLAFKLGYEELRAPYIRVLEEPSLRWDREVYVIHMDDALREFDVRESMGGLRLNASATEFVPGQQ